MRVVMCVKCKQIYLLGRTVSQDSIECETLNCGYTLDLHGVEELTEERTVELLLDWSDGRGGAEEITKGIYFGVISAILLACGIHPLLGSYALAAAFFMVWLGGLLGLIIGLLLPKVDRHKPRVYGGGGGCDQDQTQASGNPATHRHVSEEY